MPNDRDISLLRSRGYEDAAQLLEAVRAGEAERPTSVAQVGVVGGPAGPMPPPGKAALQSVADAEKLSDSEFAERFDEVQAVLRGGQ